MDIKKQSTNYIVQGICMVTLLNLCCSLTAKFWGYDLLVPQIVSTVYILILEVTASLLWRWVALNHRDMLPTFYTAVSGFRFLSALLVMLICYLAVGKENIMTYIMVFLLFYMLSLIHHSIFFAKVSNRL
jgi:hypothetical protein